MIRATELGRRAVVDVDAAEKLGKVDRIVLDPDARRVAGFIVSRGNSFLGGGDPLVLSAETVHAIGPDAITVHRAAAGSAAGDFGGLPRVSDMIGRKVVSDQGRVLGTVDDVLIDEADGRIIGYALADAQLDDKIKNLVSKDGHDKKPVPYLRADANLRAGKDLIVAPEDALSADWDGLSQAPAPGAPAAPARWNTARHPATGMSPWLRRDGDAAGPADWKGTDR